MLETKVTTSVRLSPQVYQYLQMLQLNSLDMADYLQGAYEENPVFEIEYAPNLHLPGGRVRTANYGKDGNETPPDMIERLPGSDTPSLFAYVQQQIRLLPITRENQTMLQYIAADMDTRGYLSQDIEQAMIASFCISHERFEILLKAFQALEPCGIGARSLSECLQLQLLREHPEELLALQIVTNHWDDFCHARYQKIASFLGVRVEEVAACKEVIRKLQTNPGAPFDAVQTCFIYPDLFILRQNDDLVLQLNQAAIPTLSISEGYPRMMQETEDAALKAYITEKLTKARMVITNIQRRQDTLLRCGQLILNEQRSFFLGQSDNPKPLQQSEAARLMEVSASTVSRILSSKYLQCDRGIFPLSYFFPAPLQTDHSGSVSIDSVKRLIVNFIKHEDKANPLSDSKIEALLSEQGFTISRRMVANYRKDMNIPSSSNRKQYK